MPISRRGFLQRSLITGLTTAALGRTGAVALASAAADAPITTPDQALQALLRGNRRFVAGRSAHPHQLAARVVETARGQHPFAVILGCADSRVAPEIVFDQGIGDLFVVRVAGNIASDDVYGSIEFAAEEFGTPLVVVLGHARCGAVRATLDAIEKGGPVPHHIDTLVAAIRPIAEAALQQSGDRLDLAVRRNAQTVARQLAEGSEILEARIRAGQLRIVSAHYSLDGGAVELLA